MVIQTLNTKTARRVPNCFYIFNSCYWLLWSMRWRGYLNGFSPRMIRIKNKTIANTSKIWIKLFTILNPTKPNNHKINKIIAIVVII